MGPYERRLSVCDCWSQEGNTLSKFVLDSLEETHRPLDQNLKLPLIELYQDFLRDLHPGPNATASNKAFSISCHFVDSSSLYPMLIQIYPIVTVLLQCWALLQRVSTPLHLYCVRTDPRAPYLPKSRLRV